MYVLHYACRCVFHIELLNAHRGFWFLKVRNFLTLFLLCGIFQTRQDRDDSVG